MIDLVKLGCVLQDFRKYRQEAFLVRFEGKLDFTPPETTIFSPHETRFFGHFAHFYI